MNIEAPLNVQHFKNYELKKKKKKKNYTNIKAPLNVHNFKTKPPFDKWSISYDRGLQNTDFVNTMMKAPPCAGAFQKRFDSAVTNLPVLSTWYMLATLFRQGG